MDKQLDKTMDKLDALIQKNRSSIGNPRVIETLNDLNHLTRMLQQGKGVTNIAQIRLHINKLKELIQ